MKVSIECTYCGHQWEETIYNKSHIEGKSCNHGNCRHKQLIIKDLSSKIDYYQGSPPFPIELDDGDYPYRSRSNMEDMF